MKVSTIVLLTAFGLLVVSAILGNYLESSGAVTREKLGSRGVAVVIAAYFGLFCAIAFSAVPVALRIFLAGQAKIGNEAQPIIRWLQTHQQTVVHLTWCFFVAGLVVAFALAKDQILKQLR